MRAILLEKFGDLDSLVYKDVSELELKAGHVVIGPFGINDAEMQPQFARPEYPIACSSIRCSRECPKEVGLESSEKLICLRFVNQFLPPALTLFCRSIQLRIAANPRGHPKRFRRVVRALA